MVGLVPPVLVLVHSAPFLTSECTYDPYAPYGAAREGEDAAMAKLKEVRALKSTGVEPLAPTLIKRILHNLVLKAEDRRWASETIATLSIEAQERRERFDRLMICQI
jgi:hypothetical protein